VEDSNHRATYSLKPNHSSDEINKPISNRSEPLAEQEHPNHENQSLVSDSIVSESIAQSKPPREHRMPKKSDDYLLTTSIDYAYVVIPDFPQSYEEAVTSSNSENLKAAMKKK